MVARHVEKGNVQPADEVLEVVERQVAAAQDQVRPDRRELVAVESLLDLVGDGEDAQLGLRPS